MICEKWWQAGKVALGKIKWAGETSAWLYRRWWSPLLHRLCANCVPACPQEGGKGKERKKSSKSSWFFAGSSGQRFAVEEDEAPDASKTALPER